jgi:hypothetical protein
MIYATIKRVRMSGDANLFARSAAVKPVGYTILHPLRCRNAASKHALNAAGRENQIEI